jgi:NhaP-type Na+/H+ or K+/H+ antiporter
VVRVRCPSQRLSFASNADLLNPAFTYTEALAFAALISAVDPVSTIAIFGNLGVDRCVVSVSLCLSLSLSCLSLSLSLSVSLCLSLSSLSLLSLCSLAPSLSSYSACLGDRVTSVILLGESILNDAVAIVLYHYLSTAVVETETLSVGDVLLLLVLVLWSFVASLILGALAGLFGTFLVGRATAGTAHSNAQLQVSLVLLFAYIAYELAETMGFSGIVAALAAGIVTKRYAYTHMNEDGRALSKKSFGMLAQVPITQHCSALPSLA